MTLKQDRAKLAEVKRTLAEKYENLRGRSTATRGGRPTPPGR